MKKLALGLLLAAAMTAPASAAIDLGSAPGPYTGPGFAATKVFTFDAATPEWNQPIYTTNSGARARPFSSTGGFGSVGPTDGSPGTLNLAGFDTINTISFLWGSIDNYNLLEILGPGATVLKSYGGTGVIAAANGDQSDPAMNRLVTLTFTGADRDLVTGLRFSSSSDALEFDNVAIAAVPEPASWALMIGGFGLVGAASRRRVKGLTTA